MDLSILLILADPSIPPNRFLNPLKKTADSLAIQSEVVLLRPLESVEESFEFPQWVKEIQADNNRYARSVRQAIKQCRGRYVIMLDVSRYPYPELIRDLWKQRDKADIVVGSRFSQKENRDEKGERTTLKKALNRFLSFGLAVPVSDLTGSIRLYRKDVLESIKAESTGDEVYLEMLVKAYANGWSVAEIPVSIGKSLNRKYSWGGEGKFFRFGRICRRLWYLRNSVASADYDRRAFSSLFPLQRYWQRTRHRLVQRAVENHESLLDVGCGSGMIINDNPKGFGMDINFNKLRFLKRTHSRLVQASASALPFKPDVFKTVICSEVIEHIPKEAKVVEECQRVLQRNGCFVVTTPDYGKWTWPAFEWIYERLHPGGYVEEHITPFTFKSLRNILEKSGFSIETCDYLLNSIMIIKARKTGRDS